MSTQVNQAVNVRSYRMSNIDMMRGLVILIMASDHVRDYFFINGGGVGLDDPTIDPAFYFIRWISNFCAPVFVLLAGTSVGFMEARRSKNELAKFVFTRGIWLIFIEIFIISTAFTFSPFGDPALNGATLAFMQVIWGLGSSMIVLSGAIYFGPRTCLMIGATILLGNNLLDPILPAGSFFGGGDPLWLTLLRTSSFNFGPFLFVFGYPVIPWTGVILLGYGSSFIFMKEPAKRDALLKKIGISFIAAFFVLRLSGIYGDPMPWQSQELGILPTIFDFFYVLKYPPSLLYVLITLGPMAILCAYADKTQGKIKDTLVMFGRVPFAFYVVHFYLIHILCVFFGMYQGFEASQMMRFFFFLPEGYGTELGGMILAWVLVMLIMYPFCKWVMKIKSTRKDWWLSYL